MSPPFVKKLPVPEADVVDRTNLRDIVQRNSISTVLRELEIYCKEQYGYAYKKGGIPAARKWTRVRSMLEVLYTITFKYGL